MRRPLTAEQGLLADGMRAFVEDARAELDADPGARSRRRTWTRMAAQGWAGVLAPESSGGLGLGPTEVVIAGEEIGRALLPVPFLPAAVAATTLLAGAPDAGAGAAQRLLEEVARGDTVATAALPHFSDVTVAQGARGMRLDGRVQPVLDADIADVVVFAVPTDAGPSGTGRARAASTADTWPARAAGTADTGPARAGGTADTGPARAGGTAGTAGTASATPPDALRLLALPIRAEGLATTRWLGLDERRVAERLSLQDVSVDDAEDLGTIASHDAERCLGHVLLCVAAECVGAADAALALAVGHARQREQFGRPIGSFQAVAHPLAAAHAETQRARSLVFAAAQALDQDLRRAPALCSMAKVVAVRAARTATERAIQAGGAIAYTMEHAAHRYYRRARAAEHLFGATPWHLDRVSERLPADGLDWDAAPGDAQASPDAAPGEAQASSADGQGRGTAPGEALASSGADERARRQVP